MTKKNNFRLVFPENFKKNGNLPVTKQLSFDDLGDFIEEREKVKRTIEGNLKTELKVDYSDFANHVFFDSAESKLNIAKTRVLQNYPFNQNAEDVDAYFLTSSGYEKSFIEAWPKCIGYLDLNGNQYISASDYDNNLYIGSSSLYVSTWIKPVITNQNIILQVMSASASPVKKYGYEFYVSGATDPHIKFTIYSGSEKVSVSSSYVAFTTSFNNVAVIFDKPTSIISLYINETRKTSASLTFGPIEFNTRQDFYR